MHAKPPAAALRLVDDPVPLETQLQLRNSLDVPTLLAEVQSPDIQTEKLVVLAMTAWKQHTDSARILTASIRALRARLPADDYRALLAQMPGFAF
jgi:hypothetical protein